MADILRRRQILTRRIATQRSIAARQVTGKVSRSYRLAEVKSGSPPKVRPFSGRKLIQNSPPLSSLHPARHSRLSSAFDIEKTASPGPIASTVTPLPRIDTPKYIPDSNISCETIKDRIRTLGDNAESSIDLYSFSNQIGKGSYSKVLTGTHRITGVMVAGKVFNKTVKMKKILRETKMMNLSQHPKIVRVFELLQSPDFNVMITEYCEGGDLLKYVRNNKKLSEMEAKPLFRQMTQTLLALHEKNIVHWDLKLDNVVLNREKNQIKLWDFGIAKRLKNEEKMTENAGTPAYLPPEVLRGGKAYNGYNRDLWSLGVCLFCMLVGHVPFGGRTKKELKSNIIKGRYDIPEYISLEAKDLIQGLLNYKAAFRYQIDEILDHNWFITGRKSIQCLPSTPEPRDETTVIDMNIVAQVCSLGFSENFVRHSVAVGTMNPASACYYMFKLNK